MKTTRTKRRNRKIHYRVGDSIIPFLSLFISNKLSQNNFIFNFLNLFFKDLNYRVRDSYNMNTKNHIKQMYTLWTIIRQTPV